MARERQGVLIAFGRSFLVNPDLPERLRRRTSLIPDRRGSSSTGRVVRGVAAWAHWPLSGTWMLGLFVGIELLLTVVTIAMLGLTSHRETLAPTREHRHLPA